MRSENLTINAAAGGAAASSRLDIRAAAGITGAYVAYMMGSGFSTGQEILQYFACYGMGRGVLYPGRIPGAVQKA